jgi:hypothetical protein
MWPGLSEVLTLGRELLEAVRELTAELKAARREKIG